MPSRSLTSAKSRAFSADTAPASNILLLPSLISLSFHLFTQTRPSNPFVSRLQKSHTHSLTCMHTLLLLPLSSPGSQIMVLTDPEFESSVLISSDEGASYQKYRLTFYILSLLFHPTEEDWALAYSHDQKVRLNLMSYLLSLQQLAGCDLLDYLLPLCYPQHIFTKASIFQQFTKLPDGSVFFHLLNMNIVNNVNSKIMV